MLDKTFFYQIESISDRARQELIQIPAIANCLQGKAELITYRAFLQEAYHHVKHTVPLLMACGARLPQRLNWLQRAIVHYVEEEVGHEEWILNDLESLGVDKETVRQGQPHRSTELMVSYAYDRIARHNPVSLFAMVYVLEKTSSTIATYAAEKIASTLSLSSQSMSYMHTHGSLDVEHMEHFETLMERLDEDLDREAVLHCVPVFYELYSNIFRCLPLTTTRDSNSTEIINQQTGETHEA